MIAADVLLCLCLPGLAATCAHQCIQEGKNAMHQPLSRLSAGTYQQVGSLVQGLAPS